LRTTLVRRAIPEGARKKCFAFPNFHNEMTRQDSLCVFTRVAIGVEGKKLRTLCYTALIQVPNGIIHVIRSADCNELKAVFSGRFAAVTGKDNRELSRWLDQIFAASAGGGGSSDLGAVTIGLSSVGALGACFGKSLAGACGAIFGWFVIWESL
jgi:hypothetical protein